MACRMGIPKCSARMGVEQNASADAGQRSEQSSEEAQQHEERAQHGRVYDTTRGADVDSACSCA